MPARALPALAILFMLAGLSASAFAANERLIERGRYLVVVGGCNDCHTAGFAPSAGRVPEKDWLMGDQVGYQGPWGTTYPPNLRLSLQKMSEAQWLSFARQQELRPPMPFWALRTMSRNDLRAVYHYIRSLPLAGEPAPAFLPPGQEARGPVIRFPAPPK